MAATRQAKGILDHGVLAVTAPHPNKTDVRAQAHDHITVEILS